MQKINEPIEVNPNLIFDVGMHKGEDTSYYLQKGFQVVAFEANPDLINLCKKKFSKEIKDRKLIIIEGAIVGQEELSSEVVEFYKNQELSIWGTVVPEWSLRNEKLGTTNTTIKVPTIDFSECLKKFGMPYYLKIDIEGMDRICLEFLLNFDTRPSYISIESEKVNFDKLNYEFELLNKLGYHEFQIIDQSKVEKFKEPINSKEGEFLNFTFEIGSSGLFGQDLVSPWITKKKALRIYKWIFYGYRFWGDESKIKTYFIMRITRRLLYSIFRIHVPAWYDTHAKHSSFRK